MTRAIVQTTNQHAVAIFNLLVRLHSAPLLPVI